MRYLMLVLTDPSVDTAEDMPLTIEQWVDEAYGTDRAVEGDRLRPAADAKRATGSWRSRCLHDPAGALCGQCAFRLRKAALGRERGG